MYISKLNNQISPLDHTKIRISCNIKLEDKQEDNVWVDVPKQEIHFHSESGNPWVLMFLPLAMTIGENIETELPVDSSLIDNIKALQRVWCNWYSELHSIKIICPVENQYSSSNPKIGCFFSGGVDSFFSLIKRSGSNKVGKVDSIIPIWGLDIPLDKPEEFKLVQEMSFKTAKELNVECVPLYTNFKDTFFTKSAWGTHSHGCALAGLGLILEKKYKELIIGSTHTIPDMKPWGSHVLTDPLLSTGSTKFIHDGATYTRVEKTKFIAGNSVAMNHLRVCWQHSSARNCGSCGKCVRTMTTLHLINKLKECKTFGELDLHKTSKVFLLNEYHVSIYQDILAEAILLNNSEIQKSIEMSIKYSAKLRPLYKTIDRMGSIPFLWKYETKVRQYLTRNLIL